MFEDRSVNILTVVANESYETYVATLQSEIEAEYGADGLPPKPPNARERKPVTLRKEFTQHPEFRELWDRIRHKTRYSVTIDTERLITDVVTELNEVNIQPARIEIAKAGVQVGTDERLTAIQMSGAKTAVSLSGVQPLPNLVNVMANLLEFTTPPMRLTRRTLLEIFKRCSNKSQALDNPHAFATEAVAIIKRHLTDQLVDGIKYEKINDWYEMTDFKDSTLELGQYLVPTKRGLYDYVVTDSDVERNFVTGLEARKDVKLYVKLPDWFTVDTPIGKYNPDWAIIMEDRDKHGHPTGRPLLYLVRETKGTTDKEKLQYSHERYKVKCAPRHFQDALGLDYRIVTNANDLP